MSTLGRCQLPSDLALRSVGDPVDVVTGAFFDDVQDFVVHGAFSIIFNRTYSSARNREDRGLGLGHAHGFDHQLKLDLDGIRYTNPRGSNIELPALYAGVSRVARLGYILRREPTRLRLTPPEGPELFFEVGSTPYPRLVEMRDANRSIHIGYDLQGKIASLADDDGNVVALAWDRRHLVGARVTTRGASASTEIVRYRYQGDLLVEVMDAYRHSVHLAYDEAGRVIRRIDRSGFGFQFVYDADGRCVHSRGDDGALEVRLEYFPFERRTVVTKSDGGRWEYQFDDAGTITTIVAPEGVTRTFVPRPEDGQVALAIDGAGREIRYVYDSDGYRVAERDAKGRHYAAKRPISIPETPAQYELGHLAVLPDQLPTPELTRYLAPEVGKALVLGQGNGEGSLRQVRNVQGLLIREERDGRSRRYAYDAAGNIRWKIDLDGSKKEWVHVSNDHRVRRIDGNGRETQIEISTEEAIVSITDAGLTRTVYPRNARGEVIGVSRANVWKEGYRRDGGGLLVQKTNASGARLYTLERGPQGEVLERSFAGGGFERYTYDFHMRRVAAETPAGKQTFEYESNAPDADRIADLRDEKGVRRRAVDGQLLHVEVLDQFLTRYRYFEEPHARRIVITDPTGRRHTLRDHRCGVFSRELADGRVETTQYHPAGHCLSKTVHRQSSATPEWERRFEYSPEGYLVAKHDSSLGSTRYEHDTAHQLVREQGPTGSIRKFDYDVAGNLLQNGPVTMLYHPGNVLAEANGRKYEHDLRQAVSSECWGSGYRRFSRDERDQLVGVETFRAAPLDNGSGGSRWVSMSTWKAEYDAFNRRVSKTVDGRKTAFYWDGERLAAEIGPDGGLRIYVYADTLAMTPLLFVDYTSVDAAPESGIVHVVFADHLGCPERIEDADGRVVWAAVASPYGALTISVGADFHQPMRWPGHYYDAELGLHYNRFRTYSPALGRYLEPDPIGHSSLVENLYAYTKNPLYRVDIDGRCPADDEEKAPPKTDEEKCDTEEPTAFPSLKDKRGAANTNEHVEAVIAAINDHPNMSKKVAVTVIEHADGTVSVGLSASGRKTNEQTGQPMQNEVVNALNKGDPNGPYRTGPAPDIQGINRGPDGAPMPNNCSEPHAASVAGSRPEAGEPVGYQTAWAGTDASNPHTMGDPPARTSDSAPRPTQKGGEGSSSLMSPCGTCGNADNAGKYDATMHGAPPNGGGGTPSTGGDG